MEGRTGIPEIRRQLALANRILARQGVVDAFGHVSQRSHERDDRYFISRSLAPALVKADDIVELDLAGDAIDRPGEKLYLERFIHGEIYRRRPDVQAVIHSHSPSVLPFSVLRKPMMRCVCHTAGFIGQAVPIFEIRDVAGDSTDLLIRDPKLGVALAECLGSGNIVLMRGHGSTAVGRSLQQAVFHAVYAEINARVQFQATLMGDVTYLSDGESRLATSSEEAVARAWEVWCGQVASDLPD